MKNKTVEMAYSDDPTSMIRAGQKAIIGLVQGIVRDLKAESKAPGMTWEQIEYVLELAMKKNPTVIQQEEEF